MLNNHLFRVYKETNASMKEWEALLDQNVVFYSPILTKPVVGRDRVLELLSKVQEVIQVEYFEEFRCEDKSALFFRTKLEGHKLEGATLISDRPDGVVTELVVMMRPLPVVQLFKKAIFTRLSPLVSADAWDLP